MKKKTIIIIIVVVAILALIITPVIMNGKNKQLQVKTAIATVGNVESKLSTTGVVESKIKKQYFGPQSKVKSINCDVGDEVSVGDILVNYEVQDMSSQVRSAEIQYRNANIQYNEIIKAKNTIQNNIDDISDKIEELKGSENDPVAAQTLIQLKQQRETLTSQKISKEKVELSKNSVEIAKIAWETAKNNAGKLKSKIVSGIDGVVTEINATQGTMDSGMKPAIVVEKLNALKVVTKIGKFDSDKVFEGQDVIIKKNNKEYKGKVTFINPIAKSEISAGGNQTNLTVEIAINGNASGLIIGFEVDVEILLDSVKNVTLLPVEALSSLDNDSGTVFTIENNKAKKLTVTTGIQSDTFIEIKKGLTKDTKVILNPGLEVEDGILVKEK